MPSSTALGVLVGKLELVGGVDLGLELDRLDRRALEAHRLDAVAALAAGLCACSVRVSVSGLYCSAMMRSTRALSGSISTRPPLMSFGELGKRRHGDLRSGGPG